MSRDITPFGLRMPAELKQRIDAAAKAGGRSINSEIIDRLQRSFDWSADGLADLPDGLLLEAVLARFEAKLQIIVAPDMAEALGLDAPAPTLPKKSRS